jgi:hypothetical protein
MIAMRYVWTLLSLCIFLVSPCAVARASQPDLAVAGLRFALEKHISRSADWLTEGDFKSLGESAGEATVLAELLRARSDDAAWQRAFGEAIAAAKALQATAGSGDAASAMKSLDKLRSAVAASTRLVPTGQPLDLPASPGVRPLMHLASGVQAEAKVALLTGNAADAKKAAAALAELARLMSNSRSADGWAEMSDDLRQACMAAAQSPADDKATLRQLLRDINERCETCHDNR